MHLGHSHLTRIDNYVIPSSGHDNRRFRLSTRSAGATGCSVGGHRRRRGEGQCALRVSQVDGSLCSSRYLSRFARLLAACPYHQYLLVLLPAVVPQPVLFCSVLLLSYSAVGPFAMYIMSQHVPRLQVAVPNVFQPSSYVHTWLVAWSIHRPRPPEYNTARCRRAKLSRRQFMVDPQWLVETSHQDVTKMGLSGVGPD
ncbi:hypothetical protein OH76DRAFT_962188 [Lentinus brumalis]|uniref:Uncharacterized protein n=1 Tax=Lentinus brumalis TaxID=2498619 RepID=A0A371DPJ8_9APHY|nr:hypothetical protein OH76DRAFT_962188 [Polyporus brumalis]